MEPTWESPNGDVKLWLGDCLDIMPSWPDGCVDAVVTDPPYGMSSNTDSRRFTGGVNLKNRDGKGREWGAILGDDSPFDPAPLLRYGRVVMWGSNHYAQRLPVGTTLIWIKRSDDLFGTFMSDCELAWMKGGHGVYAHRKQFPPPSRMKEHNGTVAHPTQKPICLMEWCIDKCKAPVGGVVVDPYMGSGTTGVACIRTGRQFLGIEKEPKYFDIAVRRIEAELNRYPLWEQRTSPKQQEMFV